MRVDTETIWCSALDRSKTVAMCGADSIQERKFGVKSAIADVGSKARHGRDRNVTLGKIRAGRAINVVFVVCP